MVSKRILILADLHPNKLGSIEEFDIFLARELSSRGYLCYFSFIAEPSPDIRILMEEAGARIADIFCDNANGPKKHKDSAMARAIALYRFIRDEKIDLVHINFYTLTNPLLMGAYLSAAKIVFTDHTSGKVPERGRLKDLLSRAMHGLLTRRIARYVGVSDFVRNRLAVTHHVGYDKAVTIYNGVNLQRFVPRDQTMARIETKLPKDAKIIVAVAMLIPEKGIQHLIEAASILVDKFGIGDLYVVVAGEGYYRKDLEKMANELGVASHIRFLGRRNDVDSLVAASNVVAVPAVWAEAFGLIIAEAMAAGRPVIASRVGGIPELINDKETGLLFESGDNHGLAQSIYRLFTDDVLTRQLIDNALAKTGTVFNLSVQVVKVADLYGNVLHSSFIR